MAPSESALTLLTLRFPDEILPEKEVASAKVTSTELSMAKQLIEQMSGKFVPSHFMRRGRDLPGPRQLGPSFKSECERIAH